MADMLSAFPQAQPFDGFVGGCLIGLGAAVLLIGSGRIAGISGIFARAISAESNPNGRIGAGLFSLGLVAGALIYTLFEGSIEARFPPSLALLALAGFVVGIGTRLGSGCTSGHGVCGLSRFSPRSIAATGTFMATGIVTVAIVNAVGGGW